MDGEVEHQATKVHLLHRSKTSYGSADADGRHYLKEKAAAKVMQSEASALGSVVETSPTSVEVRMYSSGAGTQRVQGQVTIKT